MKRIIPALAFILSSQPALAATYYVSATGKDSNNGTTTTTPFLTIQHAANLTKPGDIVSVMNGTFGPFIIPNPGTAGHYITYQALPGQHPTVRKNTTALNGIQIGIHTVQMSYVIVNGFIVTGNAQSVTLAQATAADATNFTTNGTCIDGYALSDHIIIRNNIVSYCPGGGINEQGDYVTIHHNVVHHNAFWSSSDFSGISVSGHNSDTRTGVKIVIDDNLVYNNQNYVCNRTETNPCRVTDGNGIIIDNNITTGYTGRIQVFNNISHDNGGKGISSFHSHHVDIFNNTTYMNDASAALAPPLQAHTSGGEIAMFMCDDFKVENNIQYGSADVPMMYSVAGGGTINTTNLVWDYNILFNSKGAKPIGSHDLVADPRFVNRLGDNFHLQTGSPAIGTGTNKLFAKTNFDGKTVSSVNRGAF